MMKTARKPTIRPARSGDIEAMVSLLRLLFTIEEDFDIDEERQRRGLALMLDNRQGVLLVAEVEGQVIGMCSGQILISTAEGGPALLMEDVVVAEGFRGHGTGRLLVTAMGEWAAAQGASRLQLLADRKNNYALAFYARLGWRTTGLICLRKYEESGQLPR
jgi:ribosomal protein S18 acetylase RimI-like enzyme